MLDSDVKELLDENYDMLSTIEQKIDLILDHWNIQMDSSCRITNIDESIGNYCKFADIELKLTDKTIADHKSALVKFLEFSNGHIDEETVKVYLHSNHSINWKNQQTKALRKYCRDFLKLGRWIEKFRFEETKQLRSIKLPNKNELHNVFNYLDGVYKLIFIMLYTTGLRLNEVLDLRTEMINFSQNSIDARQLHQGKTKSSWITFMTLQCAKLIDAYYKMNDEYFANDNEIFVVSARSVENNFKQASKYLGIKITPKDLRLVWAQKCRNAGIDKDYINAMQGRINKKILAKHYTDYSIETLRIEYDKIEPLLTFES